MSPWLAVVMPLHAGEEWIGETLESLAAEADGGVEVIAIDSSPDEGTARLAEAFRDRLNLRLIRRGDVVGWHAKTNLAVEMAAAPHACMLHQDDLWLPGRAAAVRRWIAEDPEAALHLAPTAIVDRNGRRRGTWRCPLPAGERLPGTLVLERLLVQNFASVPAPLFRRDCWLACGGMDTALWYTSDWDVWLKLAAIGPVRYHREVTTAFRVHGSSLTMTGSRDPADFEEQMRIVLDRHAPRLPPAREKAVGRAARASIRVNVALAAASAGDGRALLRALRAILSLGPSGMRRYLRDSRLAERVFPRLRARLAGAF